MPKLKEIFIFGGVAIIVIVVVIAIPMFLGETTTLVMDQPLSGVSYELRGTPVSKGDRILGIDVNMASDHDFEKAVQTAKSAGMQTVGLSINWDMIEKTPGSYVDPESSIASTGYYPTVNTRVALYLRSIDTGSRPVPADLANVPHDDPRVAERYLKMLDYALSKFKDIGIEFLSVGDEIDLMMGQNKDLYREFEVFFKRVKPEIKKKWPNLKVGFSATLYGLTENVPEELKQVNKESDIVLVSYYPLNDDLSVKDPKIVNTDYDVLTQAYPGRIIYVEQTGYPTSELLNSSEVKQREFIRETFKAWDRHGDQIKYVFFTWLHDLPQETIDFYKSYYGSDDKRFLEYLRTLGFRTVQGEDKEGFKAIKTEAKARGW